MIPSVKEQPARRGGTALVALLLISIAVVVVVLLVRNGSSREDRAGVVPGETVEGAASRPSSPGALESGNQNTSRPSRQEPATTTPAEREGDAAPRTGGRDRAGSAPAAGGRRGAPTAERNELLADAAPSRPGDGRPSDRARSGAPGQVGAAPASAPGMASAPAIGSAGGIRTGAPGTGTPAAANPQTGQPGSHGEVPPSPPPTQHEKPPPTDPPDPSQDRNPPTLDLLQFDPPEITDGGTTTLSIHASDDLSGVGSVRGVVSSPSGAAFMPFQAMADGSGDGGGFAIRVAIPSKAETGVWYVSSLTVLDKANNPLVDNFTAATAPPGGTLRVSSSESDSTPPEVLSIYVEKATLAGGERNPIRIEARDDHSGVAAVRGSFGSPSNNALVPFQCHAGADPGFWEGEVAMPTDAECGRWTLQILRLTDVAGNNAILQNGAPQLSGVGFLVAGGSCDNASPTLERLDLNPTSVSNEAASEILVTAELAQASRVVSVSGWAAGPASSNGQVPRIFFSCARSSSDPEAPWTGKIPVPALSAKGIWKIGLVRLQDRSLTWKDYTASDPVLAQSSFEVR